MFGKINVQKELENLSKEEQSLRNKYGRRFASLYNVTINNILNNNRIIEAATESNVNLKVDLKEVSNAMETINYEVD